MQDNIYIYLNVNSNSLNISHCEERNLYMELPRHLIPMALNKAILLCINVRSGL